MASPNRSMAGARQNSLQITEGTKQKTIIPKDPNKVITEDEAQKILESANLKGFRPLHWRLIVRVTSPPEKSTGGLFYPLNSANGTRLYDDRLGSKVFIVGEVLCAGPDAHTRGCRKTPFVAGEKVFFSRMNFGWLSRIEHGPDRGDYVGFIDPQHCEATVDFD